MNIKKTVIIFSITGSFFFASCSNKSSTGGTASTPSTSTEQDGSGASGNTTNNNSTHTGHSDSSTGTSSNSTMGSGTTNNDQNDSQTGNTTHTDHSSSGNTMDHSSMGSMSANMSTETKQLMMPMHDMMQKMMDMKMSGDVDHDFAHMMIQHHQGAIDMSKVVLQSGDDAKIKSMAEKSIAKQQKEIEQLKAHTKKEASTSAAQSTAGKDLMASMDDTMEQMQKIEYTGDADHDYAHLLIQHHKDAIDMAKVEVQHGKDPQLKAMAQNLIEDQTKEIGELEAWTKENNK